MAVYAIFDVELPNGKRMRRAGIDAEFLYFRAILFCKRLLTDGAIDDSQLDVVAIGMPQKKARAAALCLVKEGLWERTETGWRIPPEKWSEWQTTKEEVESQRIKKSEAGKKGADARWHNGKPMAPAIGIAMRIDGPESEPEPEPKPEPLRETLTPTLDAIKAYCIEIKSRIDPQKFFDHYSANGWRIGPNPVSDWRATVRKWEKTEHERGAKAKHGVGRIAAPEGKYANLEIIDGS